MDDEGSQSTRGMKRKYESKFGSERVIDTTAPLSKLLDEIYEREIAHGRKAYSLLWRLLSQRRQTSNLSKTSQRSAYHFAVPGHPLNVFNDNYDGNTYYDYFEEFPYRSLLPKYITPISNIQKLDPVVQPLKMKMDWKDKLFSLKRLSITRISELERLNEEVMFCPNYLLDLAATIDADQIPNFDDSYNWYYAGSGNMQMTYVHGVDYLVHSELSCMYVSRFHKDTMRIDIENSATFDCGHNILETICSPDNIVAIRTMNKVFILKIKELDSNIFIDKLSSLASELQYTSVAFDKHHKNILYVTKLDCKLNIVNLDRMTQKSVELKKRTSSLLNNWNSVIGSTRGTYMHIQKDCITCYDKRTNGVVDSWLGLRGIVDERECNNITAAIQNEDNHGLYFATDHHLFLMDTRCSKTRKLKVLQRWMHGLQCVPTYMSIGTKGNKQFIFLSSQWCEDLCVVSNYADRITRTRDIPGVAVPYHPSNILNVFNEAQEKMLCSDIQNPIVERLITSMSGQVVVDTAEGFTMLMQNSLGDISAHVLYPTYLDSFMEEDGLQSLHEWSKSYKIPRKDFVVTGIHDFSEIWKELRRIPDDYNNLSFTNEPKKKVNESEIYDLFLNEKLMPELLDVWVDKEQRPEQESSSSVLNISLSNTGE